MERWENRAKAVAFFMRFALADCDKIAVENPIGFMSTAYRKPDQIISPYMFAAGVDDKDNYCSKKTCLWLKGLPKLEGNGIFESFDNGKVYGKYSNGKNKSWEDHKVRSAKDRSKTFPGIARAMAEQWGDFLKNESKTDNSVDACRAVES